MPGVDDGGESAAPRQNIDTYGFIAQCPGGVTTTLEPLYEDIRSLGSIFDVSDKAEEIVADMQSTVDEATALTEGHEPISIWQYAGEEIPYPAGRWGIPNSVITLAGGKAPRSRGAATHGHRGSGRIVSERGIERLFARPLPRGVRDTPSRRARQ
ncbi:MAG: ABC transporter substrate-binding protein [Ilumatobacteraceae bacterium]|nr:ABC transporter substrate-binding protein [Ilumatobacteraceae bacterium]MBP8211124.1 ABC transporter substrate-binding protein [Ilumatobacteraceae bacterium]MBP9054265.1 ABC transporter substrate-binding protein [Ilumatobacteraceae bacterium]